MLLLVLILVLAAFGLLLIALVSGTAAWAWVSVAVSVAAAGVLVYDWAQRRAAANESERVGAPVGGRRPTQDDMVDPPTTMIPALGSTAEPATEVFAAVRGPGIDEAPVGGERSHDDSAWAAVPSGSSEQPSSARADNSRLGGGQSQNVTDSASDHPSGHDQVSPAPMGDAAEADGPKADAVAVERDGAETGAETPAGTDAAAGTEAATADADKAGTAAVDPGAARQGPSRQDAGHKDAAPEDAAAAVDKDADGGKAAKAEAHDADAEDDDKVSAPSSWKSKAQGGAATVAGGALVSAAAAGFGRDKDESAADKAEADDKTDDRAVAPGPEATTAPATPVGEPDAAELEGPAETGDVQAEADAKAEKPARVDVPASEQTIAITPQKAPAANGQADPKRAGAPAEGRTGSRADAAPVEETVNLFTPPPGQYKPGLSAEPDDPAEVTQAFQPVRPADREPGEEHPEPAAAALVAGLDDEVLVIDEHPRYHLASCRSIKGVDTIPLPVKEAVEYEFTPCDECTPVRVLAARNRAASKS